MQAAFVEHLNGPFLFDSMYAEDVEGNKLACLQPVPFHSGPCFPQLS